jgi:hypothetical protein
MRSVLKNKVLVTIIAILLLSNIALLVFFISGMKKPDRENQAEQKASHSTESFLQTRIGFTEQQITQFNKLREEHHQKLNPLFEDLRKTKDQFFISVKDSLSDSYIDSLSVLIGEKQKNLDRQVFRTIQEVRSICSPQQQIKFDSLLPKIAYKMAGHIRKANPKEDSLKRSN